MISLHHVMSLVSDCVTSAKDTLNDLLARMMRCELDDFEIVSKQHESWDTELPQGV